MTFCECAYCQAIEALGAHWLRCRNCLAHEPCPDAARLHERVEHAFDQEFMNDRTGTDRG